MRQHHWILTHNNTWHGWPIRGRSTYCGRINIEHLKVNPAVAISAVPAADGRVCTTCSRRAGYVRQASGDLGADAVAWMGLINRHLTRLRVRTGVDSVAALASKLAEVGGPESTEARAVFDQVQLIMLRPFWTTKKYLSGRERSAASLPHLKESLAAMTEPGALRTLAAAMSAWQRITRRDPYLERFNSARVVATMLRVPDPEQYVAHLAARGLPTLAAIFHPNTLERSKRDTALRGMFAGAGQYWAATSSQFHIIED